MIDDFELIRGGDNPFADAGLAEPDKLRIKADLASEVVRVLEARSLTNKAAAEASGFDAKDFSRIRHARISRFTVDRLMDILNALDASVEVRISVQSRRVRQATASKPL